MAIASERSTDQDVTATKMAGAVFEDEAIAHAVTTILAPPKIQFPHHSQNDRHMEAYVEARAISKRSRLCLKAEGHRQK